MQSADLVSGLMQYVVFVFSSTVHEAAHAWTGHKMGDSTAYHSGQVTLDPTPHIRREPVGMVLMPLLSFFMSGALLGWASAPYDAEWAHENPRRAALMAIAGPVSNALLAFIAAVLILAGIHAGVFDLALVYSWTQIAVAPGTGVWAFLAALLSILFSMNVMLCVFNLFPLPPLDGVSIPSFFMKDSTARSFMTFVRNPAFSWIGLILAWFFLGHLIFFVWGNLVRIIF